jgi:isopenicillin-N N-acyltransferase-like protein
MLQSASLDLPVVELQGTAREMGQTYGERCRAEIRQLYEIRMESAIAFARQAGRRFQPEQVLDICRQCLGPTEAFDPLGYEEFCGIADGAGLSPEQVYALNGLTDLRDVLAYADSCRSGGCSSFIIAPDRADGGRLLLGQTWDLYTSNMPFLRIVHRRPDNAPETAGVTTVGCLSLIGLNSEGIAVGNTNLQTRDSRFGVQYLSLLHRLLRCVTLDEAADVVSNAPRAAAHYFYVGGPDGRAAGFECSTIRHARFDVAHGVFVHCNHCLDPDMAELEVGPPSDSSLHRQRRLTGLLENRPGEIGVEDLKRLLSDHEGGELAICRHHGSDAVSTNACVIMSPETRELHACRGQPHIGRWIRRQLG